jgi:hypothetical protein
MSRMRNVSPPDRTPNLFEFQVRNLDGVNFQRGLAKCPSGTSRVKYISAGFLHEVAANRRGTCSWHCGVKAWVRR